MTRQQINVRLPPQLVTDAKSRGGLTPIIEKALTEYLYGAQDATADLIEDHERRISRLEEMAGL